MPSFSKVQEVQHACEVPFEQCAFCEGELQDPGELDGVFEEFPKSLEQYPLGMGVLEIHVVPLDQLWYGSGPRHRLSV